MSSSGAFGAWRPIVADVTVDVGVDRLFIRDDCAANVGFVGTCGNWSGPVGRFLSCVSLLIDRCNVLNWWNPPHE